MNTRGRKYVFLFFSGIFLLLLVYYLHILFSGYMTDIPGHILISILYKKDMLQSLPHPLFAELLNLLYVPCKLLNASSLAEMLDVRTVKLLSFFAHESHQVSMVTNVAFEKIAGLQLGPAQIINYHIAAALLMALLITLNAFIVYRLYMTLLDEYSPKSALCLVLALLAIIVTPIYIPMFNEKHYAGQGSPNVWHSPTYILMKSFAYLAFVFVVRAVTDKNRSWGKIAFTAMVIALSALAKPSFVIVFLPAVAMYSLPLIHRNLKAYSRVVLVFLPVMGLLAYQFLTYRSEDSRIIFDLFGVWKLYSPDIPVSILLAFAFPLSVLLLVPLRDARKDVFFSLAWVMGLIALLQVSMLAESGPRYGHGNFFWGYNISQDLLFIFSLMMYARWVLGKMSSGSGATLVDRLRAMFRAMKKKDAVAFVLCTTLLLLHVASGGSYLFTIFTGGSYY